MGSYRVRHSQESSESSELTRNDSSEEEDAISSMDHAGREYGSTEWTDEKHSLYLKSMEASFVDQLYNSLGFLGPHSQSVNLSKLELSRQTYHGSGTPSGQFKVLRGGCWQRINFKRSELKSNNKGESREFLYSPWIKHYKPVSKAQDLMTPNLEGSSAPGSREISSRNSKFCKFGLATSPNQIHIGRTHSREQDLIGCREEVSDQNFADEEIEGEKANSASSPKKMKMVITEPSINDQVVPHGKTPTA